jgi:hypothetical protein
MLEEREFFVRKAIGWVLRGTARKRRDLVDGRLELRAGRAAVVSVREAVKYLSERERGAVWPAGCQIRIELLNEPICRQDRVFCTPQGVVRVDPGKHGTVQESCHGLLGGARFSPQRDTLPGGAPSLFGCARPQKFGAPLERDFCLDF